MVRPLALLLTLVVFTSCAQERYEWNLAHQHLSPVVQKMPEADIHQITRLVSEHSPAPIVCMSYTGHKPPYPDEVWVIAADSYTAENSANGMFRLKKENGTWHIIDSGFDLS